MRKRFFISGERQGWVAQQHELQQDFDFERAQACDAIRKAAPRAGQEAARALLHLQSRDGQPQPEQMLPLSVE